MIVGSISAAQLRRQLGSSGLRIRVGPVVSEIRSSLRVVADAISLHYAAHEVVAAAEFADFHVSVESPPTVRRWVKRQALFLLDGNRPFKPLPSDQAFALFEWGLNWCISAHCHQFLVIHAAVVERRGRALLLPAPPGSGKSTLCAALVSRGWRLLSDELALVDMMSGALVPLPRPISLKNQSIALINGFWPGAAMNDVVHDTLKGSVVHVRPPADSVRLSTTPAMPGWIVIPRYDPAHTTKLARLSKPAAFMHLVDSAFNYSLHGRDGFDVLGELVDASGCFTFTYGGALDDAIDAFGRLADESA